MLAERRAALEQAGDHELDYRATAADGHTLWLRDFVRVERDEHDRPARLCGLTVDVTERRRVESRRRRVEGQLRKSEQRLAEAQRLARIGSWEWDFQTDEMTWSTELYRLHNLHPEAVPPDMRTFLGLIHPEDREQLRDASRRAMTSGEAAELRYRVVLAGGEVRVMQGRGRVIRDGRGKPVRFAGTSQDVTDRVRAEEQIVSLAHHDRVTGLPNGAHFRERLERALDRAEQHGLALAVFQLDLGGFKLVNQSLGREAGDELLRAVGSRLRSAVDAAEVVAREGGDEFLLLIDDLCGNGVDWTRPIGRRQATEAAQGVAREVHAAFDAPFHPAGEEVYVRATIGISLYPLDARHTDALLVHADAAMAQALGPGQGATAVFSEEIGEGGTRLSLATRLRKAVEREEFVLHYQPIVEFLPVSGGNGRLPQTQVVEAEALLRWQDPERGLVGPAEIVPLAEDVGLIEPIGDWVIQEACRQAREWREAGHDLRVAFNVSLRQLWRRDPAHRIVTLVEATGVDPRDLVVEITESAVMVDPDRTQRILDRLRNHGFRLAIDDFGTGHSSLARLGHLPIDVLKIDRSFTGRVPDDPAAEIMVTAIIELAGRLNIVPIAEGIETHEQLRFILDQGCPLAQGFLFSRPLPPSEVVID
ncbi:MAG: EAL domain-containing protein [Actinobacteria bacterium]|nr:MAG: EAL domain-containing protein [Actinomycetota bacterium]